MSHGMVVDWNEDLVASIGEEVSLEQALSSRQELEAVSAALEELGERTRKVFVLCRLDGMKHTQIAALLGISLSAVEKHLVRAFAHLAKRLADVPGSSVRESC